MCKKKLLVLHGYAGKGGGVRHSYILYKGLVESGKFDVTIVRPKTDFYLLNKSFMDVGINVIDMNLKSKILIIPNILKVIGMIRKYKYKIIKAHHKNSIFIAAISGFITSTSVIATLHGLPVDLTKGDTFQSRFFEFLLSFSLRYLITKIICVSKFVQNINAERLHFHKSKSVVIYNSIDETTFSEKKKKSDNIFTVSIIGTLNEQKGIKKFIDVAELFQKKYNIRDALFLVVGKGDMEEEIKNIIKQKGLSEYIILKGYIEDIKNIYAQTDVIVVTASNEGFGLTIIEGMQNSIPVVAFDSGAASELIENGIDGFLIKFGDIEGMAEVLLRLYKDKKLRRFLGRNGRKKYEKNFTEMRFIKEHIDLLSCYN